MSQSEHRDTQSEHREPTRARAAPRTSLGARSALVALVLVLGVPTLSGCRVDETDVKGWARKASGPRKLVAVLTHDKYARALRVEAAMTLVSMKPRGGRAVGLLGSDEGPGLLEALRTMPAEARNPLITGMIAPLEAGMRLPKDDGGTDPTFSYKDAAFALLTEGDGALVVDPASKKRLEAALIAWCQADFEARYDNTTQLYGMEQVLRLVKDPGVAGLVGLIEPDFKKVRELSQLVAELGSDATRDKASERLVNVAKFVDSPAWLDKKKPGVEAANKKSGLTVTPEQLAKQLDTYQEEELVRVFGAMKFVGKKPIVDYLLAYAKQANASEKRRAAALAALENNLDPKSTEHAAAMLDILASDTAPDTLRDVAARRVGELSREQVAARLYTLFSSKRWQVRWTAASLLLKMSDSKNVDEFMTELGKVKDLSMTEALSYGPLLGSLAGADPHAIASKYGQKGQPASVRTSALGYYYQSGTQADLPRVEPLKTDTEAVPACAPNAEGCAWRCGVAEGGAQVQKDIANIGQFVEYCLVPAMSGRPPTAAPSPTPPASASPAPTPAPEK